MRTIVVYKSKYGSTKAYAEWISEALSCEIREAKSIKLEELLEYDTIIYGGGLYAEVISGVTLITKNIDALKDKNLIVFSTGITPLDLRDYYDKLVIEKNFKNGEQEKIKVYNFLGKMVLSELSLPHRAALKSLKMVMGAKKNPTEMEKLLIKLCDADGDFSDRGQIEGLVDYVKVLAV